MARSCREYNKRRLLLSEHSLVLDLRMAFKSLVQTVRHIERADKKRVFI